jgi:hypothetical protein
MMGAAQVDNRILGCIFTDWRGKALKRRQSRSMMVGQIKIGRASSIPCAVCALSLRFWGS